MKRLTEKDEFLIKREVAEVFAKEEQKSKETQQLLQATREANRQEKERKMKEKNSAPHSDEKTQPSSAPPKRKLEEEENGTPLTKKIKEETTSSTQNATVPEPEKTSAKKEKPPKEEIVAVITKLSEYMANKKTFLKAAEKAKQLLERGLITKQTRNEWFEMLRVAVESEKGRETLPEFRQAYHDLFSMAADYLHVLDMNQQTIFQTWMLKTVAITELYTDDSFIFSSGISKIKQSIEQSWEIVEQQRMQKMQDELEEKERKSYEQALNDEPKPVQKEEQELDLNQTEKEMIEKESQSGLQSIIPAALQEAIMDAITIAFSFVAQKQWTKGSVLTLINLAWSKRIMFRQEYVTQLSDYINKFKTISQKGPRLSQTQNSFYQYEKRWQDADIKKN